MRKKILISGLIFVFVIFFIFPQYSGAQEIKFDFNPEALIKNSKETRYVPGELIVKFKEDQKPKENNAYSTGIASFDALNQKWRTYQIEPIFGNHNDKELNRYYKIKLPKTTDLKKAAAEFDKLAVVEKTTLNFLAKATWTPDDTYYSSQWALSKINASSAWDITKGSSDTVIAVIDSGVDTDHPDLASKIWVNTADPVNGLDDDGNTYVDDNIGWDFVANTGYGEYGPPCIDRNPGDPNLTADNDPNPEPTGLDEDECLFPGVDNGQHHGTSVAGIAAAITNNAEGIAGVCPNCSIMALRVLDDEGWGSYDQIAAAIVYAGDKGADVINMSLAGPYDDTVIDAALHSAFVDGSISVSAAGNGDIYGVGYDIDPVANKLSPICNDDYYFIDGGENEVIGVAATNSSDVKMSWSNYGKKYVDISAPGTGLHAPLNGGGYTSGFGGTSGATPIVSGVLGLVKSQHPTWDNKAVRDTTIDLIHNINAVNPSYAGRLGGRVDANRALDVNERLNGSGTLIKSSGPAIYLLENGQRRYIASPEIFFSHFRSWNYIAVISSSRLDDYPPGPDLLFRQGTLIKANNDSAVYQVEYPSATKRHITSADVFLGLDYDWGDIIGTTLELVSYHPTGNDINTLGSHVSGALVKTNSAAEVYLLDNVNGSKVKRHIINATVFELYFRWQDIATISDLEMATYSSGSDFRFQDGTLLQGAGPAIYLISYGQKRHLTSAEGYFARGYNWNQYIVVSDEELTNYTTGEDLN